MNKKYKIILQIIILCYVALIAIILFQHWDKETAEQQRLPKSRGVVTATCDIGGYNEKITYLEIAPYGDSPLCENIEEDFVFLPKVDPIVESMDIPYGCTDCYLYMDYRAITDTSSKQWALQQTAWTDSQGLRRIGDDYCVALGTFYGQVGDRFRITTDRGNVYTICMSDAKGYDSNGWYHVAGNGKINLVEFIVATEYLPSEVIIMGDCGVLNNIGGNVVKIERLE